MDGFFLFSREEVVETQSIQAVLGRGKTQFKKKITRIEIGSLFELFIYLDFSVVDIQ